MPQPYNIIEVGENAFSFTTSQGIEYNCRYNNMLPFLDSPLLGIYDIKVCDFEFYQYDDNLKIRKYYDSRISDTIKQILLNYLKEPLNILVYVCDSTDNRHKERQSLFQKWFEAEKTNLQRHPLSVYNEANQVTTYGCVFYRNDFPYLEILKTELMDKAVLIINEKYGE